jgi:hypothetical protein
MSLFTPQTDPMDATDPGRWGHSLANLSELVLGAIDAVNPATIVEVGAYAGDTTRLLLQWVQLRGSQTRILSIDPTPHENLRRLADEAPVELIEATSLEALGQLPPAEVYVVDGDHNYFTVLNELKLIAATAREAGAPFPLVICHDVSWPHARRDGYYAPERIPEAERQPVGDGGCVYPGDSGLHAGGLIYRWPARQEGGPRNGVLTAVEDFLSGEAERGGDGPELRLALVPAFFGMGAIWSPSASYAGALEELLRPWDRNPLLARLEANRVELLASRELGGAEKLGLIDAIRVKDAMLGKLVVSGAFAAAIAISKLRHRGEPAFSKDEIRRALRGER